MIRYADNKTGDEVKIVGKTAVLMVIWVFAVMILYPILHEGGHASVGIFVGANRVSAGIFPQAYVTYYTAGISKGEIWALSVGGMGIAPIMLLFYQAYYRTEKLIKACVGVVSFVDAGIYFCASLSEVIGLKLPNQIRILAENSEINYPGSLIVSFVAIVLSLVIVIRQNPIDTLRAYYQL